MSVCIMSHSSSVRLYEPKKRRISAEFQFMILSNTGTSTLIALALSTVRMATREMNLASLTAIVRPSCVMLQANSPAGLHEMLAAHAAKIRIMENQIAELRTLLNEVDVRKALDLVVKAVKTNELAQHDS